MNLFIIGNGFDRAHGLPTSYWHFKEYLNHYSTPPQILMKTQAMTYISTQGISEEDTKRHDLLEKLIRYMPEEVLWSNLEFALGEIDVEQIQEDNSCYMKSYGADDWSDSAHHDYQYMIKEELNFTKEMKRWFYDWIAHINTRVMPKKNVQSWMSANDLFLNFNYTDTLESAYGVPSNSILYIHGCAKRRDNLELGHHDTSQFSKQIDYDNMTDDEKEAYDEYMMGCDVRQLEADDIISDYFKSTYKDTTAIINQNSNFWNVLQNVNQVFVLGHSLSDIDMEYFATIRSRIPSNVRWYISYFSQEDLLKQNQFVQVLNIVNHVPIQI